MIPKSFLFVWLLLSPWVIVLGEDGVECEFECPEKNGSFADPCTCRRFYKCAEGTAFKNFCPTGLYWDDERKFCTYKNEAKCGPLEPKPPAEEIDESLLVKHCDLEACKLPYCFCSKTGSVPPIETEHPTKDIPQIITLMFDGAVNTNNFPLYESLLRTPVVNKTSKTDCPLRGTFFVKHDYNNYHNVEQLYAMGNEIAISSVTGNDLQNANASVWKTEIVKMREYLKKFANVPTDEVLGVRAPSLKPGFNDQFDTVIEEGLVWDSSVSTTVTDAPIWPYTLDFRIPHVCKIESCPTKSFPGIWEIPVNIHYVSDLGGGRCSYLDQCVFAHFTSDDVFDWLKEDFNRHYETNRAPYMLAFHTNWFTHPHQVDGIHKFVKWSLTLNDVYYITATELLLWMTEPSLETLKNLKNSCNELQRPKACEKPHTCELKHTEPDGTPSLRYMSTCNVCPTTYPWI